MFIVAEGTIVMNEVLLVKSIVYSSLYNYGRGPLLRLSRVSTFPRLNKLGCLDFSQDLGKTKLWGLVASLECRLFET